MQIRKHKIVTALLFGLMTMATYASESGPALALDSEALSKDREAAEFGRMVASKALSYTKSTFVQDGKTVVSVVVVDKLCHVTLSNKGEQFVAEEIKCDEGRYPTNSTWESGAAL
jgi:hypothetical protein